MKAIDMEELESICLDALVNMVSIHEFIQMFYNSIQLPILCIDVTLQAFEYAFKRPFYFPPWERAAARSLTELEILNNGYFKWQEKMYEAKCASIFETGSNAPAPASASPIIINGELVGYCGIMLEDAERERVMDANNLLSRTLAVMLNKQLDKGIVNFFDNKEINALLTQGEITRPLAHNFKMHFPSKYVFVSFCSREKSVSVLQYCRKTLSTVNKSTISCITGDDKLYFLYYDLNESSMARLVAECEYITHNFKLICGISDMFLHICEINNHRIQAEYALAYCEKVNRGTVVSFKDRYSDIVCYSSYNWFGSAATYLYNIRKLEDYDRENGTDYFRFLETYILNFCNVAEISRRLDIHRNSAAYRVKKVGEILGCDLTDPFKRRSLFLEMMFYQFRNQLRKAEKNDSAG